DLRPLEDTVDDLVLEHGGFDLTHGLGALQVGASHFIRVRVGRHQLVQALLHTFAVDLEVLRTHQLPQQEPERHAPAGRLLEALTRRKLAHVPRADPPGGVELKLADLVFDHRARHFERVVTIERIHHLRAHALADDLVRFTGHAVAHLGAQRFDTAFLDSICLAEFLIHRREALLLHFLHREREVRGLAGQLRVGVFSRESDGHGALVAGARTAKRLLEFRPDAPLSHHEVHIVRFAVLDGLAFDRAAIVDRDTVAVLCRTPAGREHRPLPAHALDHRIDIGFGDLDGEPLDGDPVEGLHLHLRHDLEHRGVTQVVSGLDGDGLDARARSRSELFLVDRLGEGGPHEIAHDLRVHLLSELLAHDGERRLSGPEALQARGTGNLLQALLDFAAHALGGHGHFEAALQTARGGQRNLHCWNPRLL